MKKPLSPLPTFTDQTEKETVQSEVKKNLLKSQLAIEAEDFQRPWGGFFVIHQQSLSTFLSQYFPEYQSHEQQQLSPKILVVAPQARLSWQYHFRRAEIWRVVAGPVGVVLSNTDQLTELKILQTGEQIEIAQGMRHRLVGMKNWGVVAEIWQHTDPSKPSNEDDIVRVEDDFGR